MSEELKIGQKAPGFSLKDQENRLASLESLKGRWIVLYFYPKDDTPGCTIEGRDFTRYLKEFNANNSVIWGISPDSVESHCSFIEKYALKVNLLSDMDHSVCEDYSVWRLKNAYGKEYHGVYRSTFVVNPDGIIAYLWYGVNAEGHAEEVLKRLKELQNEFK